MQVRNQLQRLYILHTRAYRETSLLIDCLTEQDGRLSLIARGVKNNKSPMKNILQPCIPLLASWQGRSELPILTHAEMIPGYQTFSGEFLFNLLYVNDLLTKVLHPHDPCVAIFQS